MSGHRSAHDANKPFINNNAWYDLGHEQWSLHKERCLEYPLTPSLLWTMSGFFHEMVTLHIRTHNYMFPFVAEVVSPQPMGPTTTMVNISTLSYVATWDVLCNFCNAPAENEEQRL